MIILYLILLSAVHIYDFDIFVTSRILLSATDCRTEKKLSHRSVKVNTRNRIYNVMHERSVKTAQYLGSPHDNCSTKPERLK